MQTKNTLPITQTDEYDYSRTSQVQEILNTVQEEYRYKNELIKLKQKLEERHQKILQERVALKMFNKFKEAWFRAMFENNQNSNDELFFTDNIKSEQSSVVEKPELQDLLHFSPKIVSPLLLSSGHSSQYNIDENIQKYLEHIKNLEKEKEIFDNVVQKLMEYEKRKKKSTSDLPKMRYPNYSGEKEPVITVPQLQSEKPQYQVQFIDKNKPKENVSDRPEIKDNNPMLTPEEYYAMLNPYKDEDQVAKPMVEQQLRRADIYPHYSYRNIRNYTAHSATTFNKPTISVSLMRQLQNDFNRRLIREQKISEKPTNDRNTSQYPTQYQPEKLVQQTNEMSIPPETYCEYCRSKRHYEFVNHTPQTNFSQINDYNASNQQNGFDNIPNTFSQSTIDKKYDELEEYVQTRFILENNLDKSINGSTSSFVDNNNNVNSVSCQLRRTMSNDIEYASENSNFNFLNTDENFSRTSTVNQRLEPINEHEFKCGCSKEDMIEKSNHSYETLIKQIYKPESISELNKFIYINKLDNETKIKQLENKNSILTTNENSAFNPLIQSGSKSLIDCEIRDDLRLRGGNKETNISDNTVNQFLYTHSGIDTPLVVSYFLSRVRQLKTQCDKYRLIKSRLAEQNLL